MEETDATCTERNCMEETGMTWRASREDVHRAPYNMTLAGGFGEGARFVDNHDLFHIHEDYELFLLVTGDISYWVGGAKYRLSPGSLLALNNNDIHKGQNESGRSFTRFTAHFQPGALAAFLGPDRGLLACFERKDPSRGDPHLRHLAGAEFDEALELARRYCGALTEPPGGPAPYQRELALTCLIQILIIANRAFLKPFNASSCKARLEPQIRRAIDYIDSHLDDSLTLDTLAREIRVSKYYLCREFKALTGSSIHHYLVMKRVALAKKLLLEGTSAGDACGRSGFTDYSAFVRAFKKFTGTTPRNIRAGPSRPDTRFSPSRSMLSSFQ